MDDLLFSFATIFPFLLTLSGLGFIWYSSRMRTPGDVEADVLAALSEHDALPVSLICERPPLAGKALDPDVVHFTLELLRRKGRAVRWYAHEHQDEVVYRRIA
jgi:hypothetical protein